jgi:HSP20 family protein
MEDGMAGDQEKIPISNPLVPFLGEDFWGLDFPRHHGLTVSEDDDHIEVEAHLPGLKPEDIEITFENGMLWIKGERREEQKDKKKKFYRKASRAFSYRIQIPGSVNEKKEPEASYKDGMIKVIFEKLKQNKSKKIPVKSK